MNTFPFVGGKWFITRNHFNNEIPFWKNFTENKLVVQVIHRTLGSVFALLAFKSIIDVRKMQNLSPIARKSFYFLIAAITCQILLGIGSVWYPQPIWNANMH